MLSRMLPTQLQAPSSGVEEGTASQNVDASSPPSTNPEPPLRSHQIAPAAGSWLRYAQKVIEVATSSGPPSRGQVVPSPPSGPPFGPTSVPVNAKLPISCPGMEGCGGGWFEQAASTSVSSVRK